jgi:hypothetical protein
LSYCGRTWLSLFPFRSRWTWRSGRTGWTNFTLVVPQDQLFPQDRLRQLYLEFRLDRLDRLDLLVRRDPAFGGFVSVS